MSDSADLAGGFQGLPIKPPRIDGEQLVNSMTEFSSSIPWQALTASMTLIDSHDTPRFRTIVSGDRNKHLSGVTFLMSYPGIPSIFMGDEIGLEGRSGEDSRRTINWADRSSWDLELLGSFKELVKLRRSQDALIRGGLRWIDIGKDHILFLRESKRQSLLILISRSALSLSFDLAPLGYQIEKSLFGIAQEGTKLKINSNSATQGLWSLRS
jgi:alpha-glucosidase